MRAPDYNDLKIESLGKLKAELYMEVLKDYVKTFSKIKNIDFNSKLEEELGLGDLEFKDLLEIKNQVLKIEDLSTEELEDLEVIKNKTAREITESLGISIVEKHKKTGIEYSKEELKKMIGKEV